MLRADPPLRRTISGTRVIAVRDGARHARPDKLATEEPMEIGPAARARSRSPWR